MLRMLPLTIELIDNAGIQFYYGPFYVGANCEVIIGNNVETLPDYFICNGRFSTIDIPSGVTSIGKSAFYNCSRLSTVTLGQNITSIGYYAFDECPSLATVIAKMTIPPTISAFVFPNRFNATLYVPAGCGPYYSSADYWKNFKEIIETSKIYFVDPNVESICVANWDTNHDGYLDVLEALLVNDLGSAFQGNTQIRNFNELQYFMGLNSIADSAFDGCRNLTSVILPSRVTEIGNHEVTIADVSALIDYLLTGDTTGIDLAAADCNGTDGVTIADVSALIDYLLTGNW